MTATAVETEKSTFEGISWTCQFRVEVCPDTPTHELLWSMPCGCHEVWFLCKRHTGQIMMEAEVDNAHFTCWFHRVEIFLITINPL